MNELVDKLLLCLEAHEREGAVKAVLAAVDAGLSIEDLYSTALEPFLAAVGARWAEGRTAVWEEHLIVGAVRAAVEALYPVVLRRKAEVQPVPVTVAFFCPPEETHDLGLRMLCDRFDLRGFRTVYVGAQTPVPQMIECVRATGAACVCLSASTHFQRSALTGVVRQLRAALPQVRIVVGGPAFAITYTGFEQYSVASLDALFADLIAGAPAAKPAATSEARPDA